MARIPEPELADFDDEAGKFGRNGWELQIHTYPSQRTLGVIDQDQSGSKNSSHVSSPIPLAPPVIVDGGHLSEPDLNPLLIMHTTDDSLKSRALPEPFELSGGMPGHPSYPSEFPPTPRLRTIPLPLVDTWDGSPEYISGGHNDDDDKGGVNSTGGRTGNHCSTQEWVDALAQEVKARLDMTENRVCSEQSRRHTSSNSGGGCGCARHNEGNSMCLAQIRDALEVLSTEEVDELSTLHKIRERLEGSVPQLAGWFHELGRRARNPRERHEYFEELRRFVLG